jgi:hypothetical protein
MFGVAPLAVIWGAWWVWLGFKGKTYWTRRLAAAVKPR